MLSIARRAAWIFAIAVFCLVGNLASVAHADVEDGLIAYWPLDGNAIDQTGNGNNGTIFGAVPVPGKIGGALSFDGVNDEVVIGIASPPLNTVTAGPHSYSAWVLLAQSSLPGKFVLDASAFGILDDYLGDQRGIRFLGTTAPIFKWVTDQRYTVDHSLQSTTPLTVGVWHHIACVYNGSDGKVYVDGQLSGQMPSVGNPTVANLWKIGNISAGGVGTGFFPGLIDDVKVYNRALTGTEVAILANSFKANAGADQSVDEGATGVTLDGSQSLGDQISFEWRQIAGVPDVAIIDSQAATTSFNAPYVTANTTLTFELRVTSAAGYVDTDTVNVTIKNVNHAPVAIAGLPQIVNENSSVTLSGTSSYDPDGDPITCSWTQTSGELVSLQNADTCTASFGAPEIPGGSGGNMMLAFTVTISDGEFTSESATAVMVEQVNHPPVAAIGPNQTMNELSVVNLSGLMSSDPDGDSLTYSWTQTSGPAVLLSDPTSPTPNFTAPEVGPGGTTFVFELIVSDNGGLMSAPAATTVTVMNVNDPPNCNTARALPSVLWPPNHRLTSVQIVAVTDPQNDNVTIIVTGVTQDEPVNGTGDGDTNPDAVLMGSTTLVRAERAGGGNGRVYEISFTVSDGRGGSCVGSVNVGVPHNRFGSIVDDGQVFDSTTP